MRKRKEKMEGDRERRRTRKWEVASPPNQPS